MPTYYDRIYTEAASCNTTGNITWTAAATQFALPPASVNTTVEYTLLDSGGTKWETGRATLTESGGTYTITRGGSQTVLVGSNGTSAESFTNASTHKLFITPAAATLNAFPIANIDLDGGTDIGADLADADLLLVDDGGAGTNRKTAVSRVRTYANTKGTLLDMGETVKAHGTQTSAITIDVDDGHVHTLTTTSGTAITITLDNTTAHTGTSLTLIMTKAGTETITWAGDFNGTTGWIGGTPPDLGAADVYVIFFHWLGSASTCYAVYGGAL